MQKLPLGIQTFSKIREDDYTYVDKTEFVRKLADRGQYYFLSRPRRFGKSLFVDTLKEAFEGNERLFKGLDLENHWDWSKKHPVLKISFGGGMVRSRQELERRIRGILHSNKEILTTECPWEDDIPTFFSNLIRKSADQYGQQVVILVDEYDKPILDNITDTDTAVELREALKSLYSVIKDNDAYIRFAFLTGVSKFSKVSLFSGLNNLKDITLNREYATICGYTQSQLEGVFEEHLQGLDLELVKQWYNGYSWLGENVYNPFGILNVLQDREYRNYWFETATPAFLIELLRKNNYPSFAMEEVKATGAILEGFEVERISLESLLFQTGYLTIKNEVKLGNITQYTLGYPNMEVKSALNDHLLIYFVDSMAEREAAKVPLYTGLLEGNPALIHTTFKALFAAIPHDWYRRNRIDEYEGYYASVFYSYFASLGLVIVAEDATSKGNVDLSVKLGDTIYLFEFKMVEEARPGTKNTALEQLKAKNYHEKYQTSGATLLLIGIEFSKTARNIVGFEWEKIGEV